VLFRSSRHSAPDFVLLAGLELMQLRRATWLARALFVELLAMADHVTGRIETSYAVLCALCDFDQAPGRHAADRPTMRRLRTAVAHLVELGLLRVDRIANAKRQTLFLRVPSRVGISAPASGKDRGRDRAAKPAESTPARPRARRPAEDRPTERQRVQEQRLTPLPPVVHRATPALREELAAIKDRIAAKRLNGAPPGGE